ncbi:unnamed protein product [Rotaria socialis]|uniref:F-box domain-containing protein n=2 Tax=Rotaria socialis TaxID=392032 RepID=A0A820Y0S2_9BILA|nr:unnamed protein product [Rotaria socialis]
MKELCTYKYSHIEVTKSYTEMKTSMKHSTIQLGDLPDEILMMILKNMCQVDVLYSLIDVNQRLNTIVHDPIFTNHLALLKHLSDGSICSLTDSMLDQFCSQILPKINHKIKCLHLESSSMERILLATNYPSLDELSLYKNALTDLFKNKILSLTFNMHEKENGGEFFNAIIFQRIIKIFTSLQYLNLCSSSIWYSRISLNAFTRDLASTTLLELHVTVNNFDNCLYLLDGRFNQLHTFYVNVADIQSSQKTINNMENLPNLKYFSLYSNVVTSAYDGLIVPLVNRMINLEELSLYVKICDINRFVDGNDLKKNILNNMSRLKKLQFYIRSTTGVLSQINIPSNEDIQYTFNDFHNNHIISYVDYFTDTQRGQCHIYSYPYTLNEYCKITNNFPGGLYKCVTKISLYDERPFEYKFFLRIAQSFPYLKKLIIENMKSQNDKPKSDDNQNLPIIEYPHLITLDLTEAHLDYIELFLFDTKMRLPNNISFIVLYQALRRVTEKFTRNATPIHEKKLHRLSLLGKYRIPKYVKEYFPHTKICSCEFV